MCSPANFRPPPRPPPPNPPRPPDDGRDPNPPRLPPREEPESREKRSMTLTGRVPNPPLDREGAGREAGRAAGALLLKDRFGLSDLLNIICCLGRKKRH